MTKSGAPRKSRRKRVPMLFSSPPVGGFNPTSTDWARIEKAYGHTFSEDDRSIITYHVVCYLRDEPLERLAPFADDVDKWLGRVRGAAMTLLSKLIWRKQDRGGTAEAGDAGKGGARDDAGHRPSKIPKLSDWERGCAYGQMLLAIHLTQQSFSDWDHDKIDRLHRIVSHVAEACALAKDDLSIRTEGGEREGWFWDHLIRELTEFARQRGLPIGAPKGTDKQKTVRASRFVAFVRELQRALPEQARRHMSSDAALAQAIGVARGRPKMHAGRS